MNDNLQKLRDILIELFGSSWEFIKKFFARISHLASDTDVEGTITGVRSGVVLSGSNLWILICSTIIACIGLDTNSAAVIIGAMLISPLMSPILGIGLSLGINDREYLGKSLLNFIGAIVLSLFTAWLYFQITPLGRFTEEMSARTQPTLLDAFVAFFGGLAGIIAGSRTEKTNAIPGVAIATALMPPLCTSGYGLAVGNFNVFGGAFYLFFINAVLISTSTYIIVRLLNFPKIEQHVSTVMNRGTMSVFLILLLMPSAYFLFQNVREILEKSLVEQMIEDNFGEIEALQYKHNGDTLNILLSYYGEEFEADSVTRIEEKFVDRFNQEWIFWVSSQVNLSEIGHCIIDANPTKGVSRRDIEKTANNINELAKNSKTLEFKLTRLERDWSEYQNQQMAALDSMTSDTIPFLAIKSEIKALYPEIQQFSIGKPTTTFFSDSLGDRGMYLAAIKWMQPDDPAKSRYRKRTKPRDYSDEQDRIRAYLTVKLRADTVFMVNY